MKRILVPSQSPKDWQRLLADPVKHWRTGYSAKALAYAWEAADGLPREVVAAFARSPFPEMRAPELLLAIPEYRTDLPGGRRPSQSDLFVLARARARLVAMAVEGKVNEEFGPLVAEWRSQASRGKQERWTFIASLLHLKGLSADRLRYQLLHRMASAVLEARRFGAQDAVLLVHSFSADAAWYGDYAAFVEFLGGVPRKGALVPVQPLGELRVHAAWVQGASRYLRAR
jgi:hypothetical protein